VALPWQTAARSGPASTNQDPEPLRNQGLDSFLDSPFIPDIGLDRFNPTGFAIRARELVSVLRPHSEGLDQDPGAIVIPSNVSQEYVDLSISFRGKSLLGALLTQRIEQELQFG
jgi:hypothetical protein